MSNGKVMIINLIVELITNILLYKMSYFLNHMPAIKKIKVELDLFTYATKSGLKNATGADVSDFDQTTDLATLKWDVDKLDIDKLEKVLSGLNSLKVK